MTLLQQLLLSFSHYVCAGVMGCRQSSPREALGPLGEAPRDSDGPLGAPTIPEVPARSWYAWPFEETSSMPLTEFHIKQRGNVVFSNAYIPSSAAELDELPGHSPEVLKTFEIGRDLIYGMGYLYNTPLYIEHHWRRRIAHLNKVCHEYTLDDPQKSQIDPFLNPVTGSSDSDDHNRQSLEKVLKTIYDRPSSNTFIGIKVFVNEELVQDRYPNKKSLPECTATIESSGAFNNWICVPIVLIGFLNNFLLSTISLYRFLSLNFVEHMLHQSFTTTDKNGGIVDNSIESLKLNVRVEIVYGCRSQINFCSEYISRGSFQVVLTERSRASLKSYEEKLRKLIRSNPSSDQVLPMDRLTLIAQGNSLCRRCLFCDSLLRFTCSVCGAELCGMPSCVWRPFTGYPHGCPSHKAQA